MLKKRKHRIKRRNTEPTVNHPLVLATPSAGPSVGPPGGGVSPPPSAGGQEQQQKPRGDFPSQPPVNLADICDSPTHATAV